MDGQSLDLKQDLISQLKAIIPSVFSEGKIDIKQLQTIIGENFFAGDERYQLSWAGKSEAYKVLQQPTTKTLTPNPEQSVDWDNAQNIFIEGENLEVLKVLQRSYYGKVKMIYIDPPYNTGNDSFIYPDKFSETKEEYLKRINEKDEDGMLGKEGLFKKNSKENGQYHSNWLNMMLPRLYLARNLLKDDGVIFVSIDDNEQANLKLLMDEVFGEENFVADTIWQHSVQPKGYLGKFSVHHNYTIIYQKSNNYVLKSLERTDEHNKNYSNPDDDPNGLWRSGDVRNALYRPNLIYDLKTPSGKIISPPDKGWRWSKETMNEKINSGEIIFSEDESRIIRKIYLKNVDGRTPETIWFGKEVGTTRDASEEIKKLFNGKNYFDTPKPTSLIKRIAQLSVDKNDIILDFFAGSGTTAHAVMELNEEDGGNRKYICVQLPEQCEENSEAYKAGYKTIADISQARIKKVIEKIQAERDGTLALETRQPLGFRKYTLSGSNFKLWRGDIIENEDDLKKQIELFETPQKDNTTSQAILWELLVKNGVGLDATIHQIDCDGASIYHTADNKLAFVLDSYTKQIQDKLIALKPKTVIVLDSLFTGNDTMKTNAQLQCEDNDILFKTV